MQRVIAMRDVSKNLATSLSCFLGSEFARITQDHSAIASEARVIRSNACRLHSQDEAWQPVIGNFEWFTPRLSGVAGQQRRSNKSLHVELPPLNARVRTHGGWRL